MPYGHIIATASPGLVEPIFPPTADAHSDSHVLSDLSVTSSTRPPPRSRTGCWTCRRRKVKCDESRPVCGQCSRVSQACDYSARITFRDDTKTRMRKYSASSDLKGCPVWDVECSNTTSHSHAQGHVRTPHLDDMAGFTSLTNDDERERKASFHAPGTFNTVLRPASFVAISEDEDEVKPLPPRSSPTDPSKPAREPDRRRRPSRLISHDANWVFLDRFEENAGGQAAFSQPAAAADHRNTCYAPTSQPSFRQTHSPSHPPQNHSHSQCFPSESMLYQLPGLRPYRSHPAEHTYMPLTHDSNSANYSAPPPISIPLQQPTDHEGSMTGQPHGHITHGLPIVRNNEDARSATTPFRRVSIPFSSASGSLLEEIVGLGNAPFYHLEGDEDEFVGQQRQLQGQQYQQQQQQHGHHSQGHPQQQQHQQQY